MVVEGEKEEEGEADKGDREVIFEPVWIEADPLVPSGEIFRVVLMPFKASKSRCAIHFALVPERCTLTIMSSRRNSNLNQ